MRCPLILMLCLAVTALGACTHVISGDYLQRAVTEVSFSQVREDPGAYRGRIFILGGTVVSVVNTMEGTELEVAQHSIDRYGDITDRDISEGRFILTTPRQLDPFIYREGRLLTVAAELTGSRNGRLGEMEYRFPVLEAKELYLWKVERLPLYPYEPYFYPYYFYGYPYWYGPYFRGPYFYRWP